EAPRVGRRGRRSRVARGARRVLVRGRTRERRRARRLVRDLEGLEAPGREPLASAPQGSWRPRRLGIGEHQAGELHRDLTDAVRGGPASTVVGVTAAPGAIVPPGVPQEIQAIWPFSTSGAAPSVANTCRPEVLPIEPTFECAGVVEMATRPAIARAGAAAPPHRDRQSVV